MNTDNNLNNNLTKALKSTIIILTLLIIVAVGLMVVAFVKKKSNASASANLQSVTSLESDFPSNCAPITTTYTQNYIALESKKCGIIKVIDLNRVATYKIQY